MLTEPRLAPPPLLFALLVFATLVWVLLRGSLIGQAPPLTSAPTAGGIRILLGEGFPDQGIRQFFDGITLRGVISLTVPGADLSAIAVEPGSDLPLHDGMALDVVASGTNPQFEQSWMPARQRLALGIPLHPDRMSLDDWCTLPGIGAKLAARIEQDRQKFGDFGTIEALLRVKGIGPAKLKTLRPYFTSALNSPKNL